jgi:intein/homing endonuclease
MEKQKLDSWGRKINYKHTYNLNVFKTKNDLFYYLLGAFITDGNVYFAKNKKGTQVSLTSKDVDWLAIINSIISSNNLLVKKKNNCSVLRMFSPEIGAILHKNGCIPNKSLIVKLPKIPKKYFKDFLRGCIDGDGSISLQEKRVVKPYKTYIYKVPTCYLGSASKKFIDDISLNLNRLGFKHYIIKLQPKNRKLRDTIITSKRPIYRILFNGTDCYKFLTWIYCPDKIAMPRKFKIATEIFRYFENKKWGSIAV